MLHLLAAQSVGVVGHAQFFAVENVDSTLAAHDCEFCGRPCDIPIASNMLAAHDIVGAAIGLARDDCELWHRRFTVRVEQLGPVLDEPAKLLFCARQEARDIFEGEDRHIETIACADEARGLE